jgi:hypothetical protein
MRTTGKPIRSSIAGIPFKPFTLARARAARADPAAAARAMAQGLIKITAGSGFDAEIQMSHHPGWRSFGTSLMARTSTRALVITRCAR